MGVSVTCDICGSCDRMCRASADNQITLMLVLSFSFSSPHSKHQIFIYLDLIVFKYFYVLIVKDDPELGADSVSLCRISFFNRLLRQRKCRANVCR